MQYVRLTLVFLGSGALLTGALVARQLVWPPPRVANAAGRIADDLALNETFALVDPAGTSSGYDAGGTWRGTYTCRQGETAMTLRLQQMADGRLSGQSEFRSLVGDFSGTIEVSGTVSQSDGSVRIEGVRWIVLPRQAAAFTTMTGKLIGDTMSGWVQQPECGTWRLTRVR